MYSQNQHFPVFDGDNAKDMLPDDLVDAKSFLDKRYAGLGNSFITLAPVGLVGEQNFEVRPSKRSHSWSHSALRQLREYNSVVKASGCCIRLASAASMMDGNMKQNTDASSKITCNEISSQGEHVAHRFESFASFASAFVSASKATEWKATSDASGGTFFTERWSDDLENSEYASVDQSPEHCASTWDSEVSTSAPDEDSDESPWSKKVSGLSPKTPKKSKANRLAFEPNPNVLPLVEETPDIPEGCTLMIRNLPEHMTSGGLTAAIEGEGLGENLQALYMPAMFGAGRRMNHSYAFVNFDTSDAARSLINKWHKASVFRNSSWGSFDNKGSSRDNLNISWANTQGLRENLALWSKKKTASIRNRNFRPVLFNAALALNRTR